MASIVAPAVFSIADSRTLAGQIFGEVLLRLNVFEPICLAMVLGLKLWLVWRAGKSRSLRSWFSVGVLLSSFLLWFYYARVITPEMHRLRENVQTQAHSEEWVGNPVAKARFDHLHKRYGQAMAANMGLGVVMVFTL